MILERIKRPIENNLSITKQSTPIIYFGNYNKAKACTISLNPSDREFLDKNGNILSGTKERLCSRKKLGKKDADILNDSEANIVEKYCNDYFKINPYKIWFNKYDHLIKKFGYSYYNDSCVALDLIQWATTPFWNGLEENIKSIHLKNDLPVMEYLLEKDFEVIFLNGGTVVSNVKIYLKNIYLIEKNAVFKNRNGNSKDIKIYIGSYKKIKVIGWSTYLQSASIGGYENIDILSEIIKGKI